LLFVLALLFAVPCFAEGHLDRFPAFASTFVPARMVTVWTPEGYDPKGPPLPVLYMQDGENLYEPSRSLSHADWEVDKTVSRLLREGKIPPVIIVGIESGAARGREYLPRKLYDDLPEATREQVRASWGGEPTSDAYLRFLVTEVKPFVEAHYAVRTEPRSSFIMGSSMGGLISLYAQAEYPEIFAGSASLSMHFLLGEPWRAMIKVDPAQLEPAVIGAFERYLTQARLPPGQHRIYVDRGDQTLDAYYAPYLPDFDRLMQRLGWIEGSTYQSMLFPGTAHTESAWAARLPTALVFLLSAP
jgi:hypothetical protein